jgi:hypothetical protein
MSKRVVYITAAAIVMLLAGLLFNPNYFVFANGTKAGIMKYFIHKGYLFTTYEGGLIQKGIRKAIDGRIQPDEFMFSVTDQKVADQLNKNNGAYLELHYKEYPHTFPWRDGSDFIVDSVISISPVNPVHP